MQKEHTNALILGRVVKSNTFVTERGTYKIDIRVWRKNIYFFKYKDGVLVECENIYSLAKKQEKKGENENV